ncbi:MAG: D-isomer specific 2-hydroxyacid dehydrogenase family protein [Paracoccaceae bacterium]|nr:D-isomer specific 2-hydroxyacid dehydrogenase family protein [Paracoccaceae bacterium]
MAERPPAFVDCYGDPADRLTKGMLDIVPEIEVIYGEARDEDVLIRRLAGRRNVLVYMAYLSERVIRACPGLRTIAYLSTGLATHGDVDAIRDLGVRFEGVSGYGDRAVAEHAIAMALVALKRIHEMDREVRAGRWRLMRSEEFGAQAFGIIGLGGVGRETARIAHGLGARVIGWSRSGTGGGSPVELLSLVDVLSQSDILSLHLELNPATEGFIGSEAFLRMKPGVILVNTARAGIVEECALLDALETGIVAHAALDVFHREPLPADSPLLDRDNVTLTPHSAWLTTQAVDRLLVAGLKLLACHVSET